jgi:hypothetical protein
VLLVLAAACLACGPAHLKTVSLAGGGRDLRDLFLGGWDGHRLTLFDESAVEPGLTTHGELLSALAFLSGDAYALAYVEKDKLDADTAAHDIFCDAPACLVLVERKDGAARGWGSALAVFELSALDKAAPIGAVWIAGSAVRAPGPRRWPLLCRSRTDAPRNVHPDGAALFPARPGKLDGFARFGALDLAADYRARGTVAPSPVTCDEEAARINREEPPPERPVFRPDPTLLPKDEKGRK